MLFKSFKIGLVLAVGLCLVGGLIFGKDLLSYARSSAKSIQTAAKDSVPIEFELQRARDLIEQIIPEMHANIRLIAQEEVEIAVLTSAIKAGKQRLCDEKVRIDKIAAMLTSQEVNFTLGSRQYTRVQIREDLARRFDWYKEAEVVLASKAKLMAARGNSLQTAIQMLDRTRSQKVLLEDKIESLASQHRLVKAASAGSSLKLDSSKLAQTEKLIRQLRKRLDVAQRILAHEARFVQPIPIDTIDEKDLLTEVKDHFAKGLTSDLDQAVEVTQADPSPSISRAEASN